MTVPRLYIYISSGLPEHWGLFSFAVSTSAEERPTFGRTNLLGPPSFLEFGMTNPRSFAECIYLFFCILTLNLRIRRGCLGSHTKKLYQKLVRMNFLGEILTVLGFASDHNTDFCQRKLIRTRSRYILFFSSGINKYSEIS